MILEGGIGVYVDKQGIQGKTSLTVILSKYL